MSSALSPTITTCAGATPHADAMCRIPAGDGLGGWKARVTIGENGVRCEGRCVLMRCVTGVLRTVSISELALG